MSFAGTLGLLSYRAAGFVAGPIVRRKLRHRAARGKEDPTRLSERFGVASAQRPAGPLIWIHAASVGESLAALPLIDDIHDRYAEFNFLVTSGTVTSATIMGERLPAFVTHQYAPVDLPAVTRRFLEHWRPNVALLLESEFWPNMLLGLDRRDVPRVLVNGRVSPESHRRWSSLRPVIAQLLGGFEICLAQSERDARFLSELGATKVVATGNIKDGAAPLSANENQLRELQTIMGDRLSWIAASTHPGEEIAAARVHHDLLHRYPDLLTIIVPRHPERGTEIQRAIEELGMVASRRSAGDTPDVSSGIYIADTLGELGLWYRLAPVVFVGKSLKGTGGQNPLEPARLNCALVFGPSMSNFEKISEDLLSCGAAWRVTDQVGLGRALADLLGDQVTGQKMARAGVDYCAAGGEALASTMTRLEPLLEAIAARNVRLSGHSAPRRVGAC
jgi:3-deoxy-D-manno-octulosonic-acid transferase